MAGEMSKWDIQEGGEHYEWSQAIKFAALRLMRMTHKRVHSIRMRPFDVYQGPYASTSLGRLWSTDHSKIFFFSGIVDKQGTLREIADAINTK